MLSVDWITLRRPRGLELGPLREIAAGIDVLGVPRDLLTLIERLGTPSIQCVLERFYLPNGLTLAFIERGVQGGVLEHVGDTVRVAAYQAPLIMQRAAEEDAAHDAFVHAHLRPEFYQETSRYFGDTFLRVLRDRADVHAQTRALCLGDGEGISLMLKRAGVARAWMLDIDPAMADYYRARGVTAFVGDSRYIRGFVFGAFDLIVSYQIEWYQDAAVFGAVYANLAPYGAYYTYFVGSENERSDFARFVQRFGADLVITDLVEHNGVYLVRAVKYPELRRA